MKFANGKHTIYLWRLTEAQKTRQRKPRRGCGVTRGKKQKKNKKLTSHISDFLETHNRPLKNKCARVKEELH